jgi:hypothetical protein
MFNENEINIKQTCIMDILHCINTLNDLSTICNYSTNYYCSGDNYSNEKLFKFLRDKEVSYGENLEDKTIAAISIRGLSKYSELLKKEAQTTLDIGAAKIRNIGKVNKEADRSREKNLSNMIESIILERLQVDTIAHGIFVMLSNMIIASIMCGIYGCRNLTIEVVQGITDAVIHELKNSWRETYYHTEPQDSDEKAENFKKKIEEIDKNFLRKESLDSVSLFDITFYEQEKEAIGLNPHPHENYHVGEAIDGGDCFFHSVLQTLKQVMPHRNFGVISLRKMCSEYANSYENNQCLKESVIKDINQEARDDDIWNAYVTGTGKRGCPRKVWKKNSHTEKYLLHTGSDLAVKQHKSQSFFVT